MRKDIRRRHDAQVRVSTVCTEHSDVFDATPGGQKTRAALGAGVAEVDELLAVQESSIQDRLAATKQCRRARRTLRAATQAVVRVGRVVNAGDVEMGALKMPGAANDDELLAYSRGLLKRVSAHADAFVADGLSPDLLPNLADGIAAFATAREAQASARQRFTAAHESILEQLDEVDKAVDVLESLLITRGGTPPEVLAKLRIASRVGPRVSAPAATPPQPAPTDKAA